MLLEAPTSFGHTSKQIYPVLRVSWLILCLLLDEKGKKANLFTCDVNCDGTRLATGGIGRPSIHAIRGPSQPHL